MSDTKIEIESVRRMGSVDRILFRYKKDGLALGVALKYERIVELYENEAALQARLTAAEQERDALKREQAQEVDEFNAGYQAFEENMELDYAEMLYRNALPDGVPSYDVFSSGYAWAKFVAERITLGKVAK